MSVQFSEGIIVALVVSFKVMSANHPVILRGRISIIFYLYY